jgi:hypothetical protein
MKTALPLALILAAGLSVGPALASSRTFAFTGFDKIDASNHVNVVLKQGPYSIEASEPGGRFADLILEVRGSTLVASRRDSETTWFWWNPDRPVYTITVTAPAYSSIEVSNHADLRGEVTAPALTLTASNHADVSGKFNARTLILRADNHADIAGEAISDTLTLSAENHGGMHLSGRCTSMEASASNHGAIDGQALKCESARLSATNHGDVGAWASRQASGRADNHGDVLVYGNPASFSRDSSNHGTVGRM